MVTVPLETAGFAARLVAVLRAFELHDGARWADVSKPRGGNALGWAFVHSSDRRAAPVGGNLSLNGHGVAAAGPEVTAVEAKVAAAERDVVPVALKFVR